MEIDWKRYANSELDEIEQRIYQYEINNFSADITPEEITVYSPKKGFKYNGLTKSKAEKLLKDFKLEFGNEEHLLLKDLLDYFSLNLVLYSFID